MSSAFLFAQGWDQECGVRKYSILMFCTWTSEQIGRLICSLNMIVMVFIVAVLLT